MKKTRFLALALAAAMAVSLLAGCGGKQNPSSPAASSGSQASSQENSGMLESVHGKIEGEAATGMVDKIVVQSGVSSEDPSPFAPSVGGMAKSLLYAKLIARNSYGALMDNCSMWLAKSVTKVDDYTYDIELYDYITDSKGNKIDADDIIFSYEKSYELGKFTRIGSSMESLEKTGDYSLRMTLKTSAPGTAEDLMSNPQLDIVDKEWYESATDEERRKDPATTGPYRLVSEVTGSSIVFEAVEDYWQKDESLIPQAGRQNVKTIEFKVITEPAMSVIALENHEVDFARFNDSTSLKRFYVDGTPVDGYNVDLGDGVFTMAMFLNVSENSVLSKSVELRKAVLYALNSEDIMYAAGNDENTSFALKTLGTPAMAGAQPEWENEDYYDYNPEKAAECLKAAGYAPGEVTLTFLSGTSLSNDSVRAVVVNNLEEAGFKVELLTVDGALLNVYRGDSTQWDLLFDFKSAGTGHITGCWDTCFNPDGFTDGTSICFNYDEELVNLLRAAEKDPTPENLNAFHYYLKDQAYCKGIYSTRSANVCTDKILEVAVDALTNPQPNAMVFAADYESGK